MFELSEDEQAIVEVVAAFVDERVRPVARDLEHTDTYPEALIEQMKRLGIYGLLVPESHGGSTLRIHGGYGYSTEFDVERYFRDAPLMIVGEGTNEIQRNVIVGQLIARDRH
jgi:alkylation response protein AidB-like acyl-CoA dehydrogenase